MNFQYYVNYVTIVHEGSLTMAAKKLGVAQPALSSRNPILLPSFSLF